MKHDSKRYVVVGAGVTGDSIVSYLLTNNKYIRAMDSRDLPPNASSVKQQLGEQNVCFGKFNQEWLLDADVILLSPGVDIKTDEIQAAIQQGVEVIGDIELFARNTKKPYIAVTGSNGKSTVTTLVTEILKSQNINARAGANIGEPALELLKSSLIDMYVLELSSFQLETCQSVSPEAAVVLNVSDDHLDRHHSLDEYLSIKMSIYDNAKTIIIPRNAEIGDAFENATSFGLDRPHGNNFGIIKDESGEWIARGSEKLMETNQISLIGESGKLNVLAALALTDLYIKDWDKVLQAVKNFTGLPHRCELVLERNNIQWIDDSKGTNVGATAAAINSIERPIVLLLGGIYKGGDIGVLIRAAKGKVKTVIAFGRDKNIFLEAFNITNSYKADTLADAVKIAAKNSQAGDAVLLSPACASFDMFANYQDRGRVFQELIKTLEVQNGG